MSTVREDESRGRGTAEHPRLEDLVIITGVSGAGKSTAMDVFEDAGYFCVDNLPPEMIGGLVELFLHEGSKVQRAAIVSDARGGAYFPEMAAVLDELVAEGVEHKRAVPDGQRGDAADALQGDAPPPPARAGGQRRSRGSRSSAALVEPLRDRADRRRRLDRPQGARPAPQARRGDAAAGQRHAHGADVRELRLQERPGARRRHRARRALPAEPATTSPACAR